MAAADPHDLDDGLPILDPSQDMVDPDAPAPTGVGALKLFPVRRESWVSASIKMFQDPGQDDEPLLFLGS